MALYVQPINETFSYEDDISASDYYSEWLSNSNVTNNTADDLLELVSGGIEDENL